MDFFGYDTCRKLIWASGEGSRIVKQGSPKTHINNTSPASTLGLGCTTNKDTYDILSEDLVSSIFQAYYSKYWALC